MLGAFKFWGSASKSAKSSPRRDMVRSTSSNAIASSVDDEEKLEMSNFGHLLTCALCRELFTHPVLLPCNHSLCYGCARAQIAAAPLIASSIEESAGGNSLFDDSASVTSLFELSRQNSFTEDTTSDFSSPRSDRSKVTSPFDCCPDNGDCDVTNPPNSPIVLSTKDLLHFQQTTPTQKSPGCERNHNDSSSFTPGKSPRSRDKLNSSSSGRKNSLRSSGVMTSSSSLLRHSAQKNASSLRRSSSMTSVARVSLRQKNYESLKRSKVKQIYCPTCERNVELGSLGISGLFRNFGLESIVERFRSKAKAAVAIRCGYCKPPASDATKSCLNCKLSYCNECFKVVHIWGTKKAQHEFVGPTNNFSRPKVLLCPEHGKEAVTMYCNRCKKSVCRMCKSGSGNHANHPMSTTKAAFKEGRERLCANLQVLKQKKAKVEAKITSLGEAFKDLEKREWEAREEIHSSIDEMHRLLEKKRNDLLGRSEASVREQEKRMRADLQSHYSSLMHAGVTSFAEEILKESDPSYFLLNVRMVEERLKEAIDRIPDPDSALGRPPASELHVSIEKVKGQLDKLDFLQIPGPPLVQSSSGDASPSGVISWMTSSDNDVVDCYEVRLRSSVNEEPQHFEKTTGNNYRVPEEYLHCDVTVRAINKAGEGEWSSPIAIGKKKNAANQLQFVPLDRTSCDVTIDASGRSAEFRCEHYCAIKGDAGYWNGEHRWRLTVTSQTPSHVILGVTNLSQRDKNVLHGSESRTPPGGNGGTFLHFAPATTQHLDSGNWPTPGLPPSAGFEPAEFGTLHFQVEIQLTVRSVGETTISICDVTQADRLLLLLEKSITCLLPVSVVLYAKGQVKVVLA